MHPNTSSANTFNINTILPPTSNGDGTQNKPTSMNIQMPKQVSLSGECPLTPSFNTLRLAVRVHLPHKQKGGDNSQYATMVLMMSDAPVQTGGIRRSS